MTGRHGVADDLIERLDGFIAAGQRNELTDDGWRDFEQLLRENDDACRLYAEYMDVSIFLPTVLDMIPDEESVATEIALPKQQPPVILWTPLDLGDPAPSSTGFLSGWAGAYLTSAVICGIGILILASIPVYHHVQLANVESGAGSLSQEDAEESAFDKADEVLDTSFPPLIGQITGMVDCKWSDDHFAPAHNGVPLGRKYALASGLMEITYHSGAKVVLEGPCTYEVESETGGYLSVGKLTARVEKGPRSKAQGPISAASSPQSLAPSPSSNPSLSTLHSPLFTIKTPTATVTDLGTEFGVMVSEEGLTEVHVLQGAVDAQIAGLPENTQRHERVTEGRAVQIKPKSAEIESVAFAPQPFTRKLKAVPDTPAETAYINAVLADNPMGYWPLNEPSGSRKFLDRSGNGFHGYAMNRVAAGQPGPLSGGSRAIELDGHGYIDGGRRDEFAMKNDFTVESWVWIDEMKEGGHVLSILGEDDTGWGLMAGRRNGSKGDAENPLVLYLIAYRVGHFHFSLSKDESIENRWHHVAATYDRANTVSLYLNSEPRGSIAASGPALVGPVWLQIGCARLIDVDHWRGRLAHIAVYPRVLTSQQIQNHYIASETRASSETSENSRETVNEQLLLISPAQ